jgi:transcriptional regulator with XRE-family HTH domain
MDLGKSLRIAIAEKGIKHKDLADHLGVHSSHITKWLREGSIGRDNLVAIAEYFEMPVSEFVKLGE